MILDIYGASDIGCVRKLNEDSFCVYGFDKNLPEGFCLVSDGMGGHNAGEVASQKTIYFVAEVLMDILHDSKKSKMPKDLYDAVVYANKNVFDIAAENQRQQGMGATFVGVYFDNSGTAYIANVGDSRCYSIKCNEITRITKDHSVVEEMITNGFITKEEARTHPQRNIITRAVGTDLNTKVDVFEYEYKTDECMLLCSDGLSSMIEDEKIAEIVNQTETSQEAVETLIAAANNNGGHDNITVICIRFKQEG